MKYSHEEYDAAIRRATGEYSHEEYDKAIKNAVKGGSSDRYAEYDKAIRNALKGGGSDSHEEYDRAIKAAIESQKQYSHEEYDKAIARALGVNGNKNKGEKNTENILTSVRKSDSLEEKINADGDNSGKWITVRGSHVLLDKEGNAIGGPLKGQNFSEAKSEESSGKGEDKTGETEKAGFSGTPKENSGDEHQVKFSGVSSEEFCLVLAKAKDDLRKEQEADGALITSWRVSNLTPDEIAKDHPGARMYVTEGGSTVTVDENHDIFAVCRNPNEGEDGLHGKDLIKMAIEQGGDRLDSYSGNHGFYTKLGFEPVSWCKFDPEYAPADWDKERDKEEPVIFYKYTGKCEWQNDDALKEWLKKTSPSEDYEGAKTARDEIMKKDKGEG